MLTKTMSFIGNQLKPLISLSPCLPFFHLAKRRESELFVQQTKQFSIRTAITIKVLYIKTSKKKEKKNPVW